MALLEVSDLKFKYKDENLFNDVSFRILESDHIVIVGDNGVGKTTFLNLISKNLIPDSGTILWQNNVSYSYLDQHLKVNDDISIHDYIIDVFIELFKKEELMNSYYEKLSYCDPSEYDKWLSYAESIQNYLDQKNFYWINSTLGNMINGLGINEYGLDTKLGKLSGGQRAKVYLAKMLLENKDVLILDEPTNFLDVSHIEWLSKFLHDTKKAFVVVSHDKSFISAIANTIYDLNNKKLTKYNMNYESYLREKAIRDNQYLNQYKAQQEYIKKTEEYIKKNIVRATTSRQAKSRRKMLMRLEKLEKPKNHTPMNLTFPFSKNLGDKVLELNNLTVGYKDKKILENINFLLSYNKRLLIKGKNGIGKTTIIKTIIGEIEPILGTYSWGDAVTFNYFAQEELYNNETPISYLRYYYHLKTDYELRTILASAGLRSELHQKKMNELSGGEQTKVRLALMSLKKSNVLIFDEPTNHLDIHSKAELWDSIDKFEGSVIIVSHDMEFCEGLLDVELSLIEE